ncbi:NAD-dependent epimerase/dehydratase family protein [Microbacterium sp. Mu-80]|uniref:NAD-dependent epimerase/dehydratase family protein n=1 Tax=Microbacterium bandirmense TaxID=3122050 RepID=A0ABU8LEC3_9MICO
MAQPQSVWLLGVAGVAAMGLAALGFADDLRGLRALPRLGIQISIAILATTAAAVVTGSTAWWFLPFGAVLMVGYVNTANFMDGINALSGLHGAVVGTAFAVVGTVAGQTWLMGIGLVIAVAFVAFLPWNLSGSGFFLGDVGSYLLGGSIAVTALFAIGAGLPVLTLIAPLAVYIADTVATMLRRLIRGERITAPHRTHAYQRLTDTGWSHISVAAIVTLLAMLCSTVGLAVQLEWLPAWIALPAILLVCWLYLALPRLRGSQLPKPVSYVVPQIEEPAPNPAIAGFAPKRWAVFGASGFVGNAVMTRLKQAQYEVVEIKSPRLSSTVGDAIDVVKIMSAAESDPVLTGLADVLADVDVVINAAGLASPDSAGDAYLYGANSLLPAVVAAAGAKAGVTRMVHLSSAAVQGRRPMLDNSTGVAPFSAYSHSKALGEQALLDLATRSGAMQIVVLRATSVQGPGRPTTQKLIRLARSPLASVAAPGTAPSVVSSITKLAATTVALGASTSATPRIALQPWEGLSTRDVLKAAAPGREPRVLPAWLCRALISCGFGIGKAFPALSGISRRLEVMWFGQGQIAGWQQESLTVESLELTRILGGAKP